MSLQIHCHHSSPAKRNQNHKTIRKLKLIPPTVSSLSPRLVQFSAEHLHDTLQLLVFFLQPHVRVEQFFLQVHPPSDVLLIGLDGSLSSRKVRANYGENGQVYSNVTHSGTHFVDAPGQRRPLPVWIFFVIVYVIYRDV